MFILLASILLGGLFVTAKPALAEVKLDSGNVHYEKGTGREIAEDAISIDTKCCLITIDSKEPVYYSYLKLSAKKYIVKQSRLTAADMEDGKYVIDYSSCKPTQAYCIGIGIDNNDYTVDGFTWEYKDQETYVSDMIESYTWTGNKYYHCNGSNFSFLLQIDAYYKAEVDRVGNIKWNTNYKNETVSGARLIMSAGIYSDCRGATESMDLFADPDNEHHAGGGLIESSGTYALKGLKLAMLYKKNRDFGDHYKKKTWSYPFIKPMTFVSATGWEMFGSDPSSGDYADRFPYDFIWREKGSKIWVPASDFTLKKLKEYMVSGANLEFRFNTVHDCHTGNRVNEGAWNDTGEYIWGDRFGVPQAVKIPKGNAAAAPKITINACEETITIKNGMEYSFDQVHWYAVLPYLSEKKYFQFGMDRRGQEADRAEVGWYYENMDPDNSVPYTMMKISKLNLKDLYANDGGGGHEIWNYVAGLCDYNRIYVRKLATGNRLPSETAVIPFPTMQYKCPDVKLAASEKGGYLISDIVKDESDIVENPIYEYQVVDYISAQNLIKEKLTKAYKKYSDVSFYFGDSDYTSAWTVCKKGQTIKTGKIKVTNVDVSYTAASGKSVNKKCNVTVNVPLDVSSYYHQVSFRRKGIENKKDLANLILPSEEAYFTGLLGGGAGDSSYHVTLMGK